MNQDCLTESVSLRLYGIDSQDSSQRDRSAYYILNWKLKIIHIVKTTLGSLVHNEVEKHSLRIFSISNVKVVLLVAL